MGSSSCLKFHFPQTLDTDDDDIFLSLKIEAEAIIMQCNKHVIFYSRDHKLEWEYMKRCDTAGSCSIDKCVSIKPNEDLPELSNRAKSSPGYTSCAPGCGCVNCGCFYCDPACLFYRYYAQPTSETLYEVSRCATWSPILRLKVTLNENSTIRQDLLPGVKFQLPGTNISITAINLDNPPIPAHLAPFITAYSDGYAVWHSFTHTQPSAPGVPTRGLVGELHCATKSDAESFDCTFDPALCRCVGFATKVSCECRTSKISDYKLENRLPFKGQHHTIQFDRQKERITIESVQDSLVALQVEAVNATINRQTTITRCTATQIGSLSGCHSCEKGAKTTIGCSSRTSIKALLDCPNFQTSIECGLKEVKTEIIMSISSDAKESMLVDFNCSVSCGIVSLVQIRGQLDFESTFVQTHGAASFQERIADATSLLSDAAQWLYDVMFKDIFIVGMVVIGFVCALVVWKLVLPYAMPLPQLLVRRSQRRRKKQK
ncbi:hypothetical protein CRE_02787 [Caenorhabditis remanei]|uniref:Phlebovirus glycoprotein G2 fusion domain-containing protein n=1 Tax=Caenorhabditis remanei TaxID=31234 RepID=E3NVN0_CAERE|nr:hypothetical protein CRE_02787 [Caenorhabditis remanei]